MDSENDGEEYTLANLEASRQAEDYGKVLEIRNGLLGKRFVNSDWEKIYRYSAEAAFVVAGGLAGGDQTFLEQAFDDIRGAIGYGASGGQVLDADYCRALALCAKIMCALGQKESALNYMDQALTMYPNNCDLSIGLVELMIDSHDFEEAIPHAIDALKLANTLGQGLDQAYANYYLGLAYAGTGKPALGRKFCKEAVCIFRELGSSALSDAENALAQMS